MKNGAELSNYKKIMEIISGNDDPLNATSIRNTIGWAVVFAHGLSHGLHISSEINAAA